MSSNQPFPCPLCRATTVSSLMEIDGRAYWRCEVCALRFLDPRQLPGAEEERAQYRHHQNHPGDPDYRRFLSKLAAPLLEKLSPGLSGLDYGCGPGPALAMMLEEAGHRMALYDPLFFPDEAALATTYDVITCTEVAEHFHCPAEEFDRLDRLLRPRGWLGLMTCFQTDDERFAAWHYRRDPTHVVFYREATMLHLARMRGWICHIPVKNVALMQKTDGMIIRPPRWPDKPIA